MNVDQSVELELFGENPPSMPLYPTKILHDLTWNRIQAIEEGNRRLAPETWHDPLYDLPNRYLGVEMKEHSTDVSRWIQGKKFETLKM
jgi:hypothetical protein